MRIANLDGRLVVVRSLGDDDKLAALDVERASGGRFGADPQAVYAVWDDFVRWAEGPGATAAADVTAAADALLPPVPRPSQVFAIGLNYRAHADESGMAVTDSPPIFTKFPSCLTGARSAVPLPSDHVDYEVELVAVIGRPAYRVSEADAWSHVAGLTIGQDLSEREVQLAGSVPQFSMGKSFPGFGPVGPVVVTPDELAAPDDLRLGCRIGDEVLQDGRTAAMIFPVAELIARLSAVLPLSPGDIVFTGTPDGVGMGRTPQRYLRAGELLTTWIEGIGELRNPLIGPDER